MADEQSIPEASFDHLPEDWDVVVVGAGVAGASAAGWLARQGRRVLLVERSAFPRFKVCGSCINLRALECLEAAGMMDAVRGARPTLLREAHIIAGTRSARVPLPGGLALTRATLDSLLVQSACRNGATFLPRATAVLGPVIGSERALTLRREGLERPVRARAVLAAGGLQGNLLARSGASSVTVEPCARIGVGAISAARGHGIENGVIHMACGAGGYAGLVQVEGGQVAIAAALDPAVMRDQGGPAQAVADLLANSGVTAPPDLHTLDWKGTPPLTRQSRPLAAGRVFLLGDAAGYVEPFTGEGMAWALAAARDVADLLESGFENLDALEQQWDREQRRVAARRRLVCRTAARALRSPRVAGAMVGAFACSSLFSRPFVRFINARTRS